MRPESKAENFLRERAPEWEKLDQLLRHSTLKKSTPEEISLCFALHRDVSADLARARSLGLAPTVLNHLSSLLSRSYSACYAETGSRWRRLRALLSFDFPRSLRKNWRLLLISSLLFWFPFAIALWGSLHSQSYAAGVLPLEMLEQMTEAYRGELGDGRSPGGNVAMAGFYVQNNIGIAFRCFATGILFGIGSAFFLVENGAITGAVVGHVIRTGGGVNILSFVAGHAPLELTAIVIAGAAGLQMGHALLETRGRSRLRSLYEQRDAILAQVLGATGMLLLAAVIEGFWSPSSLSNEIKWIFGGVMATLVMAFLLLSGRTRSPRGVAP